MACCEKTWFMVVLAALLVGIFSKSAQVSKTLPRSCNTFRPLFQPELPLHGASTVFPPCFARFYRSGARD